MKLPLGYVLASLLAISFATPAFALDESKTEFAGEGTWKTPPKSAVREQLNTWLATKTLDDAAKAQVDAIWADAAELSDGDQLLDRLAASFAVADPQAATLVTLCSQPKQTPILPEIVWLADTSTPELLRNNLRLYFARWLIHNRLFDESLSQLETLEPEHVVDPAGLLFYQSIVYQRSLKAEPGLAAINRLLEKPDTIPHRYASLAKLLQADLTQLKEDSLDHIARRMDDVHRRLDLGRAGPKTREVEDGVIKSLDKLIKELEDQAAAAAAAANAQGSIRSSSPAPDSRPMGGKGPGQVASKDIGHKSGWGELPPKERQEALQQIGKDFPAHYRDMIEQYFKKLATEDEQP